MKKFEDIEAENDWDHTPEDSDEEADRVSWLIEL